MTHARLHRGMTLVELMVGMAIGLFLVSVMSTIYVGSKGTFLAQESTSRLQENGRFAMDTLANDLRMSGFRGCMGEVRTTPLTNTLNTPGDVMYDFAQPTWGSHFTGGAWLPALSAPIAALAPSSAGDVLVLRRPVGSGWSLTDEMDEKTSALTVNATGNLKQGDLLLVADCGGGAVLQATNATPGLLGSIEHVTGAAGMVPGVTTGDLGRVFLHDAQLWRMQTAVYFLAPSVRRPGQVSLWSFVSPRYENAVNLSELVTGVERMAVSYGIDTNGDYAADGFRTADAVIDWGLVVSARVELLLVGAEESVTSTPQPYLFDGVQVVPTDRRLRTVMSLSASLRNSVP
ncbi:PilW family protein [Ideonella sp. A 288]|uniref:PilW family protein n=1 Tax=Ideonella sp. A 288 TaxID=1962181 RepID=UPI000B4BBA1C|nr:PilW family protein [Ideonella sp. A 288]